MHVHVLYLYFVIYLSFCSIFDLQSCNPDPLLPSLLDRTPPDELDSANEEERQLHRIHSVFSIYPIQQVTIGKKVSFQLKNSMTKFTI